MNEVVRERDAKITRDVAGGGSRTQPKSGSRRRLAIVAGVMPLASAAAWFGYGWWSVGRFLESTDDAYIGADVTSIAAKIPGLIETMAVADNRAVRAGDLLFRLDDRDYRAALAKAEAAVGAQEAALANLEAMRSLQDAVIAQARADVDGVMAEVTRAQHDQTRYRQLASSAVGSIQSFEKADADAKKAVAGETKSRAVLEAALRQINVIATQRGQVEAALRQAEAERDLARLNLGYSEVRAPIDGFVGNRSGRAGTYATAGAQILSLVPARGLWVDANFKESQIAHIHPGQKVRIFADILPDEVFTGHVESLAPATGAQFSILPPENATGNFTRIVQRVPVRISLDGEGSVLGRLRPGLSVKAAVDVRAAEASRR